MTLSATIEALLFAAGEPVSNDELARAAAVSLEEIPPAIEELRRSLLERLSALQVVAIAGGWQLATRPDFAEQIGKLLARGSSRLTRAALETLAIVAYRQPVTAPEVEAIRGVSSDGVLKTLLERRLISEAGRRPTLGRPMQYRTTTDFLHYFGISDLSQLPQMDLDTPTQVPAEVVVDGRVHSMLYKEQHPLNTDADVLETPPTDETDSLS